MMLRLVTLAMAATFFMGLAQTQPWAHPAWTGTGWERFIVAMAATAVATLTLNRWCFYVIVLVLACSTGVVPVIGLGFVLLGALNLGWLLFRQEDDRLNLLGGFAIYVAVFSLTASLPVNTIWLWGVLLAVPISLARRLHLPLPNPCLPVALPLVANFLLVSKPEISSDGLSQHLAIAEWVKDHARFHFDAANQIWAVQPMAGDWALTLANLYGGEIAARMLNFVWLLVMVSFVYSVLRRRLKAGPAGLITGVFAATPLLQLTSTSMFIENFWAAMVVGALLAIGEGEVVLAAALLGASAASKLLGFTPVPVLAAFAVWKLSRAGWRWKPAATAVSMFLAIAVVPYARAYMITGNPVFHYANAVFKSPLAPSGVNFEDNRYPPRLSWRTLYDVTFHTDQFVESEPGTAGYQWLWFIPLALAAARRSNATERAAFLTAIFMVVLVFSRQASLRYVECAMPLLTIAFGAAASRIVEDRWFVPGAGIVGVGVLGLNLFQMAGSSTYHRDFCLIPFIGAARERYVEQGAPVRILIAKLNETSPGATVADVDSDSIAGLRGAVWTATWHTPAFSTRLLGTSNVEEYIKLMHDFNIAYVIAPRRGHPKFFKDSPLDLFVQSATDRVTAAGNLQLVRLLDRPRMIVMPIAKAGRFDDTNARIRYTGSWTLHQLFPEAGGGTVSYSSDRAASVQFDFIGSQITYVFTKAPNRGTIAIEIDGVAQSTVDLHSEQPQWQVSVKIKSLGPGPHTIVLRNSGPTGRYIDLDEFIVE